MKTDHLQQIRNQSENDDIPQEPGNLRFATLIVFFFKLEPELQPMAVQCRCHVIQTEITLPLYCAVIG